MEGPHQTLQELNGIFAFIIFAKTLPKSTSISKAGWMHRGPYNVGGRTRALAVDVL